MKRYINLILSIFVCFLCACGGGNNSQGNSSMPPTDENSGIVNDDQSNVDEQPSGDESGVVDDDQSNVDEQPSDDESGVVDDDQSNMDEQPSDDDSGANAEDDEIGGSDKNDDNGDSDSAAEDDESDSEPLPEKVLPGNYAGVTGCSPFKGSEFAALKVLFINVDDAPHFQALVHDAVERQFLTIEPFNEFYSNRQTNPTL